MFGTSSLGMRARLAWLKQNKPDSPEIPAMEQAIKDEEARHPIPPPPEKKLSPAEQYTQRHDAMIAARDKEAQNRGYKKGTDEYNYYMDWGHDPPARRTATDLDYDYFFKQALAAEKARAAAMGETPNMENVTNTADAGYKAYQERHTSKGGTTPPQTPTPPPPGPPQPAASRTAETPPDESGTSRTVTGTTTPPTSTTSTTLPPTPAYPPPAPTPESTSGLPPDIMAILDQVPLTSQDQVLQVRQLQDAYSKGMPPEQARNWALYIARPPQRRAAPR